MRQDILDALEREPIFDVLVIGGGATGCGVAVDAATRGLKTALVERNDFAEGTSSRSTKLVHGGVRYLEAAVKHLDKVQYQLVREGLHERGAFLRNAPHIAERLPLVTPIYSWTELPYVFAGLKLYDLLSGCMNIGHSSVISRSEALRRFPALKAEGLKGGVVYYDGQFVDIRMAITLVQTAEEAGAVIANHVAAVALLRDEKGKLCGATVEDRLTGRQFDVRARAVVNAAGPFADEICKMDDPAAPSILKGSSGVHIILDAKFVPPEAGMLIPKTDDGRVLFILPWQGHAIVGTTDEPSAIVDHPKASAADVAYLLEYVRRYFNVDVTEKDVKAAWCGIRPLVFDPKAKGTAQLAREHVILESESGLVTIAGGKWTIYRLMGEHTVDRVVKSAGLHPTGPCRTHDFRLVGGRTFDPNGHVALIKAGLDEDVARHLNRTYGDQAAKLLDLVAAGWGARLHPAHPFLEAEVIRGVRNELAEHAIDVIARRLTLALVDTEAAKAAVPRVVELMAAELGWDAARCAEETGRAMDRLNEAI